MSAVLATDPATLFDAARGGNPIALARLLSLIERGGEAARQVAGLAHTVPRRRLHHRDHRGPRRRQVDPHRPVDRRRPPARPRPARPGGRPGHRPLVPLFGRGHPRRPGAHAGPCPRRRACSSGRWPPGAISAACRWPCPTRCACCRRWAYPSCWSRRSGSANRRWRWPAAADTTVVVVNPGWGDAVQANKAGLLEIGDLFVINKADRSGARETRRDLELMLDLTELGSWRPPIVETVATTGERRRPAVGGGGPSSPPSDRTRACWRRSVAGACCGSSSRSSASAWRSRSGS